MVVLDNAVGVSGGIFRRGKKIGKNKAGIELLCLLLSNMRGLRSIRLTVDPHGEFFGVTAKIITVLMENVTQDSIIQLSAFFNK